MDSYIAFIADLAALGCKFYEYDKETRALNASANITWDTVNQPAQLRIMMQVSKKDKTNTTKHVGTNILPNRILLRL